VTPAALTITAASVTSTYGSSVPAITPILTGLVNGQTKTVLGTNLTCTTTASSSKPVGTYPTTCTGAVDANYTISYVAGTAAVTKATLTVTANNLSRNDLSPNPTLTVSYSGFVNGDTASHALTGAPSCSTTATTFSSPGSYPITCTQGSLAAANYTFAFAPGTLTVRR
jgi:hypothetical protein